MIMLQEILLKAIHLILLLTCMLLVGLTIDIVTSTAGPTLNLILYFSLIDIVFIHEFYIYKTRINLFISKPVATTFQNYEIGISISLELN